MVNFISRILLLKLYDNKCFASINYCPDWAVSYPQRALSTIQRAESITLHQFCTITNQNFLKSLLGFCVKGWREAKLGVGSPVIKIIDTLSCIDWILIVS